MMMQLRSLTYRNLFGLLLLLMTQVATAGALKFNIENVRINQYGYIIINTSVTLNGVEADSNSYQNKIEKTKYFTVKGLGPEFSLSMTESQPNSYRKDIVEKLKKISTPSSVQVVTVTCRNCNFKNEPEAANPTKSTAVNLKRLIRAINDEDKSTPYESQISASAGKAEKASLDAAIKIDEQKKLKAGDGSPDDLTCQKYGLAPMTQQYGLCRMQLDLVRQQAEEAHAIRMQQNEENRRLQREQIAAQERERDKRRAAALVEIGGRMAAGQTPIPGIDATSSSRQPIPPNAPVTQMIRLPNGAMVNCTTTGNITNCN